MIKKIGYMVIFLLLVTTIYSKDISLRTGWAYGLGGELEYRPQGSFGFGLSAGYVPNLGAGGYLSLYWGATNIDQSGFVAETGLFYGQNNPLRQVASGLGVYALIGYSFKLSESINIRFAPGFGLPFAKTASGDYIGEFLAKLTIGSIKL